MKTFEQLKQNLILSNPNKHVNFKYLDNDENIIIYAIVDYNIFVITDWPKKTDFYLIDNKHSYPQTFNWLRISHPDVQRPMMSFEQSLKTDAEECKKIIDALCKQAVDKYCWFKDNIIEQCNIYINWTDYTVNKNIDNNLYFKV